MGWPRWLLAGDILELLGSDGAEPRRVLSAHPRLVASVRAFAEAEGHRVVYLVGNHDARLGWDGAWAAQAADGLGAELAFALELHFDTGQGLERVQVEHGHRSDPANAPLDPRNPQRLLSATTSSPSCFRPLSGAASGGWPGLNGRSSALRQCRRR